MKNEKPSVPRETRTTPNDPKLSDCGGRRGSCMAGGKAAVEAATVTPGAVRCSAWLGHLVTVLPKLKVEVRRSPAMLREPAKLPLGLRWKRQAVL